MLFLSMALFVSASTQGEEAASQSAGRNMAEMKFETVPGLPTCAMGSVQSGDPTKGPSIILAKVATGCSIPWHWHTPNENVMMVSGVGRMDMKDGKPLTLQAGGFAAMPSRHVHQFHCDSSCILFVYSDSAFDIHYVNEQGEEIPPLEAMKAVNETAATKMEK
jgi:quercetin dioxygenase-like cupin family protein